MWRRRGWNTGIFYWNQFADEEEVQNAEAKIWTYRSPKAMRYRLADESYRLLPLKVTMAEVFATYYSALFPKEASSSRRPLPEIRLVGHSLGSQLVIAATALMQTRNDARPPDRIALLDPFWSTGTKPYLEQGNGTTADHVYKLSKTITKNGALALELYRTTSLGKWYFFGSHHQGMFDLAASVIWEPEFLPFYDFKSAHISAIAFYFLSFGQKFPVAANTPTPVLKDQMGKKGSWQQIAGKTTVDLGDDRFQFEAL